MDGGDAPQAPPPPAMNPFGGGKTSAAGVMANIAGFASTLQRKGQEGEVRNANAEAIPFLEMEEILERLKMLNYEREMGGSFKPLTHTYFAVASGNPTEQFHYFCAVVAWLMSLQRIQWRAPSQMDDPNSAVSALFSQLQQVGAPTNYPPQKLKQGYGDNCCAVLKHLLDAIPIEFKRATYTEELEYEEAAVDEDAEVDVDEMADEVGAADVEEEEFFGGGGEGGGGSENSKLTDSILDTTVDPAAWQIELERVTPLLKMQILSDPKEWRNRLVNTKSHQQTVGAPCFPPLPSPSPPLPSSRLPPLLTPPLPSPPQVASLAPETYAMLDKLSEDMERTLKAVRASEQKLNQQCKDQVDDFATKQDKLQEAQVRRREAWLRTLLLLSSSPPPSSPPLRTSIIRRRRASPASPTSFSRSPTSSRRPRARWTSAAAP